MEREHLSESAAANHAKHRRSADVVEGLREAAIPIGPGGLREELLRGGMVWADNVLEDPRFDLDLVRRHPHGSAGIIPLVLDGEVSGAFYLAWWQATPPPEVATRHLLQTVGQQAGILLRNARLYRAAEERTARLRTLTRLNALISSSLDLDTALHEISRAAVEFTGARIASFWIADETHRTLSLRAASDAELEARRTVRRVHFGEGEAGWVAEHRRPLIADDALADGRLIDLGWLRAHGLRSMCGLPVVLVR